MSAQKTDKRLTVLTEEQFQESVCYSSQADDVLQMVHAVLVEGRGVSDVARAFEVSRANVYQNIDTFLRGGCRSRQRYDALQVEKTLLCHTRDVLLVKLAKLYLVNGFSCKYIARETCLPLDKVRDITHRALKWVSESGSQPMKPRREELPRISIALHDWKRFVRKVTGLSEATLEMARMYHMEGKSRHEVASTMNRRASDVYRNLQSFTKHYEQWQATPSRVQPIKAEHPNMF